VIADRLALYVNDVYGAPQEHNGLQLTLATVFFAYQIYCDFSGYSDIAIGSARVLGFRLMENFDRPYHSRSVGEFWRRWHISLSTWFRDYVYIPLGGSRVPVARHYVNLLLTFTLSGLWHGANWTYVLWGVLNGTYLVAGGATREARDRILASAGLPRGTRLRDALMLGTTLLLTAAAWVVFRARSVADAYYVLTHFASGWDPAHIATEHFLLRQLPVAVAAIVVLEMVERPDVRSSLARLLASWRVQMRWAAYTGFVMAVLMFGMYRQTQFIYFQF
jgi:D-alanyl-lipoteichoic acid acyltransferase DltB (MBOAT superfamily)